MKITKTFLRKRWKDNDFISNFPLPLKESIEAWNRNKKLIHLKTEKINNIDLRGISGNELWFFPNFYKTNNHDIDFSYGKGALTFSEGKYERINFNEFQFDRATHFKKAKLDGCNFQKSKLIFDANDTIFENCDFTETIFKGGFNEYGYRRCSFINCNFSSSQWNNLYFFACKFKNCTFTNFKISNAKIGGFKIDKITSEIEEMFLECDIDGLIEMKNNYS